MRGWGQQIDELAAATAQLLATGVVQAPQLEDAHTAMAARDAVVTELRTLVGAVAHVAQLGEVRGVAAINVTHRPAQALHQALSELPRLVEFGAGRKISQIQHEPLLGYEQAWRAAHRASVGMEAYVDALGQLPDEPAWDVLRDLADVAAAVPYLDHDLAEAILARMKAGEGLEIAYRLLTTGRHDAVRSVANELRTRVQAAETHARSGHGQSTDPCIGQAVSGEVASGDLTEVMIRYTHMVSARSDALSVADLKSVTRLLQFGSLYAAEVLERAAPAVAAASQAAQDLRTVAPLADRLREAPVRSMALPHLELLRVGGELQTRLEALAGQARRLPGGAPKHDLRRLVRPAVEFAQQVPALAGALDLSVRETVVHGVMLVPSVADRSNRGTLSWVTATMGPQRAGPSEVIQRAGQLSVTARLVAPAARQAEADLAHHVVGKSSPQQLALLAARRHAGAARDELRIALSSRIAAQPSVSAGALSQHPRSTPQRVPGRGG